MMAVCIFASSASSAGYGVAHELAFGSRGYIIHNGTVIRERPYQKNRGWKSSLSSIATAPNSLSQLAPHRPLIIANNFCDLIGHITFKSSTDFFKTSKSARKLAIKPFLQKMLNGFESWSHTEIWQENSMFKYFCQIPICGLIPGQPHFVCCIF